MEKSKLFGLTALCCLVLAASCNKPAEQCCGLVRLNLDHDSALREATKSAVSDYTTLPSAADFSLSITDAQDNQTPVSDPTQAVELAAGNYTASASFGSTSDEGWDKPCFEGTQAFTVQGGETTDVTITVKLANCIVKVETTEQFRNYYSDWTFSVKSGAGTTVDFVRDETRAAFFDAYQISVSGTLTGQNGKDYTFSSKEYKNLEAATCYTLKFDVSNVGGNSIVITFNDIVDDVELGSIDINE